MDIDKHRVYTYEPTTGIHGYEVFAHKVSSLGLLENGDGVSVKCAINQADLQLIATIDSGFAYIPFTSLPFPPTSSRQSLTKIEVDAKVGPREKRFNEGTVDPAGRFYSGTLGLEHGTREGNMYALTKKGDVHVAPHVLGGITCTNGMAWSLDLKTMYVMCVEPSLMTGFSQIRGSEKLPRLIMTLSVHLLGLVCWLIVANWRDDQPPDVLAARRGLWRARRDVLGC